MECSKNNIERYCQTGKRVKSKSKKIEQLAKSCRVGYHGPYWFFPLALVQRNDHTCARLIANKHENIDYVSVGEQMNLFLKEIVNVQNEVQVTNYRGYPEAGIYGLLYLLRRNENECLVLSNFQKFITKLCATPGMTIDDLSDLDWTNVGIVWHWDSKKRKYVIFHIFRFFQANKQTETYTWSGISLAHGSADLSTDSEWLDEFT